MLAIVKSGNIKYEREIVSITYISGNLLLITKEGCCLTFTEESLEKGYITIV